jgi:hypothetical protein
MEKEDIDTTDCYCEIREEDGYPMSAKTKEQQEGLCWECVKFDENKKQEKQALRFSNRRRTQCCTVIELSKHYSHLTSYNTTSQT